MEDKYPASIDAKPTANFIRRDTLGTRFNDGDRLVEADVPGRCRSRSPEGMRRRMVSTDLVWNLRMNEEAAFAVAAGEDGVESGDVEK